ncbi:mucin-2-like isoform X2 [Paramacrobiotus metropolitanus]|nr:mucin-2-like isoform X2 [Paramacrobiotus metropolitanus]XP_055347551.1 mucin-2-like isoform X2 [Paramacrobiotus metropolitanus]
MTVPQSLAGWPIYLPQQVIYAAFGSSNPVQSWGDYKWNNFYIPTLVTEPPNDTFYERYEDFVAGRWTPPPVTVPVLTTTKATVTRAPGAAAAAAANATALAINTTGLSSAAVAASALGIPNLLKGNATAAVDVPKTINATVLASALTKLGDLLIHTVTTKPTTPTTLAPGVTTVAVHTAPPTTADTTISFPSSDDIAAAAAAQVSAGEVITAPPNGVPSGEPEASPAPAVAETATAAASVPAVAPVPAPAPETTAMPATTTVSPEVKQKVEAAVQTAVANALPQSMTNPLLAPQNQSPFILQPPALEGGTPKTGEVVKEIVKAANATAQQIIAANGTAENRTAREFPADLRTMMLNLLKDVLQTENIPAVQIIPPKRLKVTNASQPLLPQLQAKLISTPSTTHTRNSRHSTTSHPATNALTTTMRTTQLATAMPVSVTELPSLPVNETDQTGSREGRNLKLSNLRVLMENLLHEVLQPETSKPNKTITKNIPIQSPVLTVTFPSANTSTTENSEITSPITTAGRVNTSRKLSVTSSTSRMRTTTMPVPITTPEPEATTLASTSSPLITTDTIISTTPFIVTTSKSANIFQSNSPTSLKMALPPLRSQLTFLSMPTGLTRGIRQFTDLPSTTTPQTITRPSRKRFLNTANPDATSTPPAANAVPVPAASTMFVKPSQALDKQDLWNLLGISIDPVPLPNIDHSALRPLKTTTPSVQLEETTKVTTNAADATILNSDGTDTIPSSVVKQRGVCVPFENQGRFGICVDKSEVFTVCDGMVIKQAKFCESTAVCCVLEGR